MAGSYNHIVDDQGRLLDAGDLCSMLECISGDVYEACEEMYGMIWHLAERVAAWQQQGSEPLTDEERQRLIAANVEQARQNYRMGLEVSPGVLGED